MIVSRSASTGPKSSSRINFILVSRAFINLFSYVNIHALLLVIIAGWDSRLGLELTFSRVTVKVLLYQVEQTLAVGGKEIGVLSQEV